MRTKKRKKRKRKSEKGDGAGYLYRSLWGIKLGQTIKWLRRGWYRIECISPLFELMIQAKAGIGVRSCIVGLRFTEALRPCAATHGAFVKREVENVLNL